jgi:succinyl-CoA synthetase beta subunit
MKIQEYLAKGILDSYGITVPSSKFFSSYSGSDSLFLPCVLKSQVLIGSRMKNGGILFADDQEEFKSKMSILINKPIKGTKPEGILVEKKLEIKQEYYCSIFINRLERDIFLSFSECGGINVEEHTDSLKTGKYEDMVDYISKKYNQDFVKIIKNLKKIMQKEDATYIEINPIALTAESKLVALDCVMDLDENAYFRNDYLKNYMSLDDQKEEFHYVKLDGDIGIIGCGAGIVMATMDAISMKGGKPADFLDIGGGAEKDITLNALKMLYDSGIKRIIMNIFGGITNCDEIAKAVIEFKNKNIDSSIFIRLAGNNSEIAKKMLENAGIKTYDYMYEMVNSCMEEVKCNA